MADLRVSTLDGDEAILSVEVVEGFKAKLSGELILPGDENYETARRVWNGDIDRKPALIAQCTGVADVIDAVNFSRENNLLVSIRGGAHSAAGHGTCDGGIVIDLTLLKGINVDPEKRTAQAGAGVLWGALDRETQAFGLATTGGTITNTGIAGLTLGGGLGWLMGKHGLTIDNLLSADVVTTDGRFLKASENENTDLFWGLRGGGGNFGVVTSFEYRLHPVGPIVLGGMVLHPIAKAREVLRFYRDFSSGLPDEAEAYCALLTSPEGEPVIGLILGYNGDIEEGEKVLAPARSFGEPLADLVQPMPYVARQGMLDEGFAVNGLHRYWKSGFTKEISDDLIDVIVAAAEDFSSPMSAMLFFRIHGAATRVSPDESAFGLRGEQWDFNVIGQWADETESARHTAWVREQWGRIEPLISGSAYINHIAGDDRPEKIRASFGPSYDKLVGLKNKYDPKNMLRLNPNLKPTV